MTPSAVFNTSWGLWALSWIIAAVWSAAAVERRDWRTDWLPYALIILAVILPPAWHQAGLPSARWWNVGRGGAYALAFATIPGFLFAWWARLHLGPLWSAAISRKQDHRVVDTGPYALVRHPIYTGILWAALTTDIAAASLRAAEFRRALRRLLAQSARRGAVSRRAIGPAGLCDLSGAGSDARSRASSKPMERFLLSAEVSWLGRRRPASWQVRADL